MTNEIPNLWSAEITNLKILSPLAIMRTQASNLEKMTRGLLKVAIEEGKIAAQGQKQTLYNFDIVAPALNGYRHRLFGVYHEIGLVYPITFIVSAEIMSQLKWLSMDNLKSFTEEDFTQRLGKVLKSSYTTSVIQSLLARSNEDIAAEDGDI